jgi:gamma-glutamyl-gamma-aminobutyrate hydrolase PuuD
VQWHPEGMFTTDPLARGLFAAFVKACQDRNRLADELRR